MSQAETNATNDHLPGTARLGVVVPVAVVSFFYASILEYSLPLYFGALSVAAEAEGGSFPAGIWSSLAKYQVTPWIVGPIVAGLLARRYGERIVWSAALIGKVIVPVLLGIWPTPTAIKLLALWQGFTGAVMWIAGISLVQMVAPHKKGQSNGLMMASLGLGSVMGPVVGRCLIHRAELLGLMRTSQWGDVLPRLFSFQPMSAAPTVDDFQIIFGILGVSIFVCGIAVGLWGQRPGRFDREEQPGWQRTTSDAVQLLKMPLFWALVVPLCCLGGPVFQAANQFLPYRAEDVGLKSGAEDHGWIWLQLLKTLMWVPGGAAVGWLAGRRPRGRAAIVILGMFSVAIGWMGVSATAWQLFTSVALFEFVRQFMRWSHAGYMAEHLPDHLRATAIGAAITFSGLGSTIYAWIAEEVWDPTTDTFASNGPFVAACVLGLLGTAVLVLYNLQRPIGLARNSSDED